MSLVLSCALSDRIAAVGMVAAAQTLPWGWCTDHRAVPMIAFHGTADPEVPYNGGSSWGSPRPFPSTQGWAANWARRKGGGADPLESTGAAYVTRRACTNCTHYAAPVRSTPTRGGHH